MDYIIFIAGMVVGIGIAIIAPRFIKPIVKDKN